METDEGETRDGKDRGDNVVRFPKDWIGPLEDLVPIGSRAQAQNSDTERHDNPVDLPAGASDFWGEGAAAVHEAVTTPAARARNPHGSPPSPTPSTRRPRLSRARATAASAAVGAAALAAGGIVLFAGGGTGAGGPASSAHRASTTRFTADALPLRQSGTLARRGAMAAVAADATRLELTDTHRLAMVTRRALSIGRTGQAVARAEAKTRAATHHADAGSTATVSRPSSTGLTTPADAAPAPATTPAPAAPAEATTVTPPASTSSNAGSSSSGGGTSSGGTASSSSSGGGASSGLDSGSTNRTYGYGGLLGAGHSGS